MGQRTCSVEGCGRKHLASGLCGMHWARASRGKPLIRHCLCCGSDVVGGRTAVYCSDACRSTGGPKTLTCVVCGEPFAPWKRLSVCSARCQRRQAISGGHVPLVTDCQRCGSVIDLMHIGKGGRKRRSDTKICDWCRARRYTRHKVSIMDLVNKQGHSLCGICSDPVDLSLRTPDLFRASVDHILPYSHGGSHDLANLQLAHLYCNYLKSDREGFTI